MLDQRLIRENPALVEEKLSLRGLNLDLSHLNKLTIQLKDTDIKLSNLQSESKKISKLIGKYFQKDTGENPQEIGELKQEGNKLKINISNLEEIKRNLNNEVESEILKLPNFPSENAPYGKDESQ